MTVAQTEAKPYADSTGTGQNSLGIEVPVVPPFWFGPQTWNLVFYLILAVSVGFGLFSLAVSGSWLDALVYFFLTLLGTAFLGIAFISFVVMPLFMKHQERLREARRMAALAEKAAAIERAEREKAERFRSMRASLADAPAGGLNAVFSALKEDDEEDGPPALAPSPTATPPPVEDQASSLRRMMAANQ
ncbi:MAG: hypothetical protein R2873_33870 [Caldilineaceae bacterium]|nr:hypothetical protein [Caldilineaceae bacterium]